MLMTEAKVFARLRAGAFAVATAALMAGVAHAETGVAVFSPPNLDYKTTCKSKALVVEKLDRDWVTWQGTKIDLPPKEVLSIIGEYTNGSDRVKASPQTSLKMLDVLSRQYPDSQNKFARFRARALIERDASLDDLKKAEAILLKSYSDGDVRAAFYLGQLYGSRGPTDMRDMSASKKYLQRAAAAGDVDGQLAYARLIGADPAIPYEERINQINNALITLVGNVQQGNCSNMDNIGYLYMNGELVQKNVNIGLEWLEHFAEIGNISAAEYLATVYQSVRVDQINIQKSMQYLMQAADAGRPVAAFSVGKLYATGVTLGQNRDKAIAYLEIAAKGKVEGAVYWLALIYSGEFNFMPDTAKAKELFAKLELNPQGEITVREPYGKFLGKYGSTPQDIGHSVDLLIQSANAGSGTAARNLGNFYSTLASTDVAKYPLAEKYFRLAARLGEEHGASSIGDMYSCGAGLPVSVGEANKWHLLAANLGSDSALWSTGLRAISSEDPKEQEKGRHFVQQAALRGNAEATGYLISRVEKGADGFSKDLDQSRRLIKFVEQNADPVFRHDARIAVISSRFEVASTPDEIQAQFAAIEPFVAAGDGDAAIMKAEMLDQAGMSKPEVATALMKIAADAGDPRGMRNYGKYLLSDTKKDVNLGRIWVGMAAKKGDLKAKLQFVDVGAPTARSELDKMAISGHVCTVDHMVTLATKYVSIPDPAGAVQAKLWLENAAAIAGQNSGDLYEIGAAFRDGVAGAPDRFRAEYYFMRSLALGRKSAARDLANGHLKKIWTKPDPLKAKGYLIGLLNDGDVLAGNKLLGEYANATIPATNPEVDDVVNKLQGQITSASKSLLKLARLNEDAKLGPKDESLAVKWLTISANAGDQNAMFGVSNAYINGVGVGRSVPTGIAWLQKAADAGNYMAAQGLSAAYETGFGLEKDPVKSKYWKDKAKVLRPL
jgi:TPR repeat protein